MNGRVRLRQDPGYPPPVGIPIAAIALGAFTGCSVGLETYPGIHAAVDAPVMSYADYNEIEHAEPYVIEIDAGSGALLYFGSRHTTNPADAQIDSIRRLWNSFKPTVALAEARKSGRRSMDSAIRTFGESAAPVFLAKSANIPVYTFEPPLELEITTMLREWSRERLLAFYVLRSYTARAVQRRSDGQARELIRERGRWPGLEGTMRSVADMDSVWRREFPTGPDWRTLPWESTWPDRHETWLNELSADLNRIRDQYMLAVIAELVRKGERVFAVVGSSHVVMQEAAVREMLAAKPAPPLVSRLILPYRDVPTGLEQLPLLRHSADRQRTRG
jgi:hypothetical protein